MSETQPSSTRSKPKPPRPRAVAMLFLAISVFAGIVLLSADARQAINRLGVASSDSSLWSLAQAEVELGRLELAIKTAATAEDPDLKSVRQHFDILYSRIQIVLQGSSLRLLRANEALSPSIDAIGAFLDKTVLLIDGPDEALLAGLPVLAQDAAKLRSDVRKLSLEGVRLFATRAKDRREDVTSALTRLALLTVLLVVALAGGLYALAQLFRISRTEVRRSTEAKQQLQSVVSASLDPIIATDPNGNIVEFNEAAETVFGHPKSYALGVPMSRLIFPPHLRSTMEEMLATHKDQTNAGGATGRRLKLDVMRANGEIFPAEVSVSSSRDPNSEILVTYFRDISDQIAAERELVEARDHAVAGEKAKADLLAIMNHEMRTPLNGLLGTLDLLQRTPLTEKQHDYIQIMQRSGNNLLHNVNDALEISRIDSGHLEIAHQPYDPLQLIRDILEEQRVNAEARDTKLIVEGGNTGAALILGDAARMRQILLNLIGNAIKFTRNGKIAIDLDLDLSRNEMTISVSDTGIGIDPKQIGRIFEDFVTLDPSYKRSAEGSGLGLGICKRLVEAMGGEIGVESKLGQGSAFWFRIPAEPASAAPTSSGAGADTLDGSQPAELAKSVLVVEDNQINRRVAREMLQNLDCDVTEAHDGEEGVRAANLHRYDMILMDISMPGIDGLEATRRIRAGSGPNATTPIVALTAHALPTDLDRFRKVGMTDAVTKPISQTRLAAAIALRPTPDRVVAMPAKEPSDALIDLVVLEELRETMPPPLFASMTRQFLTETGETLTDLSAAAGGDTKPEKLAEEVHRLAGSAAVFGAIRFRNQLIAQERRALDGKTSALAEGFADLNTVWEETRTGLAKLLNAAA